MLPTLLALALAHNATALAGPDRLASPLRTGATAPSDAAVVIGLEEYAFVADVPYASRDAEVVRDWLIYTRGVPIEHVAYRSSGSAEQILAAVETASAQVEPGGILWVYFSGHGMASPESGGRMLMGDDARPDYETVARRSVLVEAVLNRARASGAIPVVLVDACYTGRGRGGEDLLEGRPLVPVAARVPTQPGLVWSAASADQAAHPLKSEAHGAFTFALVGALRGWADGELDGLRDGRVTLSEAQAFVQRALPTLQERAQVPELLRGEGFEDLVLAEGVDEVPPPPLAPVAATRSEASVRRTETLPRAPRPKPAALQTEEPAVIVPRAPRSPGQVHVALIWGWGDVDQYWLGVEELASDTLETVGTAWSRGPLAGSTLGLGLGGSIRLVDRVSLGLELALLPGSNNLRLVQAIQGETAETPDWETEHAWRPLLRTSVELDLIEQGRVGLDVRGTLGGLRQPAFRVDTSALGVDGDKASLLQWVGGMGATLDVGLTGGLAAQLEADLLATGGQGDGQVALETLEVESYAPDGSPINALILLSLGPAWHF